MPRVLEPGRNCGVIAKANRFALLVDGSEYYGALAQSIPQAKHTVAVLGWDLDSRVRLGPNADRGRLIQPLRDFLPAVAEANPGLNIYLSSWSFPLLFANLRDPKLVWGQNPFNHPRIHLKFDSTHPPGASHHQKMVVIDDCLAFAGGMDVAGGRWDSPEHRASDARRGANEAAYPPYHDVMALVDGDAAGALAAIVRDRWFRSTGTSIPEFVRQSDIWPDRVQPDLVDVGVGISRTDVGADGSGECFEVEQLHLDLIDAARDLIYIENQYLTSATVVAALCRRLQTADGPEVLIVLPLENTGWLEERTIQLLRFQSIRQLRQADAFNRLRICYPASPGLGDDSIGVHSKIIAIDDQLFRVGSSNITNRSMRLDTECDLTIEAAGLPERLGLARMRNRLLAEHLGMSLDQVAGFLSQDASLIRLVDSRRNHPRCLRELPSEDPANALILDRELVDPSRPYTAGLVIEALASAVANRRVKRLAPLALICVAMAAALVTLWRGVRARSRPLKR